MESDDDEEEEEEEQYREEWERRREKDKVEKQTQQEEEEGEEEEEDEDDRTMDFTGTMENSFITVNEDMDGNEQEVIEAEVPEKKSTQAEVIKEKSIEPEPQTEHKEPSPLPTYIPEPSPPKQQVAFEPVAKEPTPQPKQEVSPRSSESPVPTGAKKKSNVDENQTLPLSFFQDMNRYREPEQVVKRAQSTEPNFSTQYTPAKPVQVKDEKLKQQEPFFSVSRPETPVTINLPLQPDIKAATDVKTRQTSNHNLSTRSAPSTPRARSSTAHLNIPTIVSSPRGSQIVAKPRYSGPKVGDLMEKLGIDFPEIRINEQRKTMAASGEFGKTFIWPSTKSLMRLRPRARYDCRACDRFANI